MSQHKPSLQRLGFWAALGGFAVLVGYAVVGVLQILVWNPLASVPGATLGEIHAEMHKANESLGTAWAVAWGAIGVLLATGVLFLALTQRIPVGRAAFLNLMLIMLAAPSLWIASFPAGMSLADTFYTGDGDRAPWAALLYLVSAAALGVLVLLLIGRWNRSSEAS